MPDSFQWPYYDDDIVVWIDPANAIEHSMLLGYDPDVARTIQRFAGPGLYCIDVGANVGAATLRWRSGSDRRGISWRWSRGRLMSSACATTLRPIRSSNNASRSWPRG